MNIRSFYIVGIVLLSLGLLYEWSSEKRNASIQKQLVLAAGQSGLLGDDLVLIESEELIVVVATKTGAIVETRLKKHLVENVELSLIHI